MAEKQEEDAPPRKRVREDSIDLSTSTSTSKSADVRTKCPYLDTINRHVIDFDFEKVLSI
jgi:U4/U6.U5 tri-snRNP-associated protein 2